MARIGAPAAKASLSAPDNGPSVPFEGQGITSSKADEALNGSAAEAVATEGKSDEEKSDAITTAVKKVGSKTKERDTREQLVDALEGKNPRRRSRRKRKAIYRTIDEAGADLRKKARVRLVRPGPTVKVKTETGQVVQGQLAKGEASRILTAEDGSKVLLVNRSLRARKIVQEVKVFIAEAFVKSAERNGVEMTPDVLQDLFGVFSAFFEVIVVRDSLDAATGTSAEDTEIERQVQIRETYRQLTAKRKATEPLA